MPLNGYFFCAIPTVQSTDAQNDHGSMVNLAVREFLAVGHFAVKRKLVSVRLGQIRLGQLRLG